MASSKQQIMGHVLHPIMSFYSPPRAMEDREGAIGLYLKALAPYPLEALQGAMVRVIAEHTRTTWPLPAEIIKAARDWIHANVKPEATQAAAASAKEDWKRYPELAAKAMQHETGQRGLREGWGRILYNHVLKHGTFKGFSTADAIRIDTEIRHMVAELEADSSLSILTRQNANLGHTLIAKESDLRQKYLVTT